MSTRSGLMAAVPAGMAGARVVRAFTTGVLAVVVALLAVTLSAGAGHGASYAATEEPARAELILFWGDGCPHCQAEKEWLQTAEQKYPELRVVLYEVWYDAANRDVLVETAARLGFEPGAVPVTVVGDRYWIGWSESLRPEIEAAIESEIAAAALVPSRPSTRASTPSAQAPSTPAAAAPTPPGAAPTRAAVEVPLIGTVDVGSESLVFSTLVIGFVDGVNPCSLWVISVLLAIVVRTGSRRRVLAIGATFLFVTALMYAIYVAGIYSALSVVDHLGAIQWFVALVAGVFGAVSVKDYFAFKQGLSFTIPDSSKPGLYKRMREAAGQERLVPALGATVALALGVSLLETPCTAGFPVLWTGLLGANDVGPAEAVGLFGLYMLPFLVDELVVFGLAVLTLRATKLQERQGRLLKLVAGTMMLALAVTVLVRPEAMSSPMAALLVFGAALLAAALVHLVLRAVRGADWASGRA